MTKVNRPRLPIPIAIGDDPPSDENTLFGLAIWWDGANYPANVKTICSSIYLIDKTHGKKELDKEQKNEIRVLYNVAICVPLIPVHIAKFMVQVWQILNVLSNKKYIRLFSIVNATKFLLYAAGKRDLEPLDIAIRKAGALAMKGYFQSVDSTFHEGQVIEGVHLKALITDSGIVPPPPLTEDSMTDDKELFIRAFREIGWHPMTPVALTITGMEVEIQVPPLITLQKLYDHLGLPKNMKQKEVRRWRDALRARMVKAKKPGKKEGAKKGQFAVSVIDELVKCELLTQAQANRAYLKLL